VSGKAPPLTEAVVLAADDQGRPIVSVHVKRTYDIREDGTCHTSEIQQPFLNSRLEDDDESQEDGIPPESDILPQKAATDLIVMASAVAPQGKRTTSLVASIEVGDRVREYLVHGDRRCRYRGNGTIEFSAPDPFERIPLRYEYAYGGADPTAAALPPTTLLEAMWPHPGIYPRNPAGRGYVVGDNRAHIEGLLLPNVENPKDPVTPRRVITGSPKQWWLQPVPWSCDWLDPTWFPRCVFFGALPEHTPDDDGEMAEVRSGFLPPGFTRTLREAPIERLLHPRCGDAASPALLLPFLTGSEAIRFRHMTPSGTLVVRLPGRPPEVIVRYRRRAEQLKPVLTRVLISLEEQAAYVVWHAAWVAPAELIRRRPEDDHPLRGVAVVADRRPVPVL
jgi:hypothetical protein